MCGDQILPVGSIPNIRDKVPAGGTISLIKRLSEPLITLFLREPSFTTGISQIPMPEDRGHMRPRCAAYDQKYFLVSGSKR
jgi:hypothetical protein